MALVKLIFLSQYYATGTFTTKGQHCNGAWTLRMAHLKMLVSCVCANKLISLWLSLILKELLSSRSLGWSIHNICDIF